MATQTFEKQTLPELDYDYGELEPVISGEIMELHHSKHHAAYVNNFNQLQEKYAEAESHGDLDTMFSLLSGLKFNGGGHLNHSIFWKILAPTSKGGGRAPNGALANQINSDFGSLNSLIEKMSAKTTAIQGSGWGWLGWHQDMKRLVTLTCPNQDTLSFTTNNRVFPLLGIDVWEHAYYLQYKNVRPDYVKAIWSIINWAEVEKRFEEAKKA